MKTRVVHVVPFASRTGGYERQARLLTNAQVRNKYELTIITHIEHAPQMIAAGFPAGAAAVGIRHRRGWFDRAGIREALRSHRPDVLHVHALDPLAGAVVAEGRRLGIPAVVMVASPGDATRFAAPFSHEVFADGFVAPRHALHNWIQRRSMAAAWRSLRHAEAFIALSRQIRDELEAAGVEPRRIVDLPNAVEIPTEPNPHRPGGHAAVFVGRLIESKRVADLLTAFPKVRRAVPDATLAIVGEGPERARLDAMAAGVPGVRFLGRLDDVVPALRAADLFVFPTEQEGCPNALLEAAAHGLACLTTTTPGVADWLRPDLDAAAVAPRDVPALIRAWIDLMRHDERRRHYAQAARARVESVAGLDRILHRYEEIYAALGAECEPRRAAAP